MKRNLRNPVTVEVSRQFCGRVKSAAMAALRGRFGLGLSWRGLGEVVEIVWRMEARVFSLRCDLVAWFGRVDGGAGTGDESKKNVTPAF